jgi:hypothetical protein
VSDPFSDDLVFDDFLSIESIIELAIESLVVESLPIL